MSGNLTPQQVETYKRCGFLFPVPVMAVADAQHYRACLETIAQTHPELMTGVEAQKLHLVTTWMASLVRHSNILDAVESLIGPDLLCWSATLFVKEANSPNFVSWHQDGNYWGLLNEEIATAWLALSPSNVESGCMQMVPGSHAWGPTEHRETFEVNNLLSRGQVMEREINSTEAVNLTLQPGEISLHHVNVAHASEPNRSSDSRVGVAIRYVTPNVKQSLGEKDSASLVRGKDWVGNFEHEQAPAFDFEPAAMQRLAQVSSRRKKTIYLDTSG